jgi:hypothetical protein
VGLIGLLLTLNRGRAVRIEPETPRIGFPMPYQPYQQTYVQQQPTSQPFPAQQPPPSEPLPAPPAPDEPGRTAPQ